MQDVIYDCETFPNVFTLAAECADYPMVWSFEISPWRDDSRDLMQWLFWLKQNDYRMVGFNNIGFDYPILHMLVQNNGRCTPLQLFNKAQAIIGSMDTNRFEHMVYPSDRFVPQLDLYKIHHFDNKARSTSLKALEFNMRMDNISDLPFQVGTMLDQSQIAILHKYNQHDVKATKLFYRESIEQIKFREALSEKYDRDFMNHSDVKIGKEIFQMELEQSGVKCYNYGPSGREPAQTKRELIHLAQCVPPFVKFKHPEFRRILNHLLTQVITETKGVFNDLVAHVGDLDFVFGTGGLHASVENRIYESDAQHIILDVDVTSLYPSIAITRGYYPEHLGTKFVDVYKRLKAQRVSYKKGTPENAMLKLALNGVYGASGDKFSIFYDPLFTMKITIGGQLMIAMLAERLMEYGVEIIQVNTDGITMRVARGGQELLVEEICKDWMALTDLELEQVQYTKMAIRDVNNYLAVKENGEIKRKGVYEYEMEWHQNASAPIIAMVAEQVLVHGHGIHECFATADPMDFMLRVKVPRSSRLVGVSDTGEVELANTQRYYVSVGGVKLVKIMPPLAKKPGVYRRIGVESGWTVCACNDIQDATLPIDYSYYRNEVEKLVLRMK